MDDLNVDAIVAGYVDRMPAAREALMRDPLFYAHTTWLRTIGPVLDRTLVSEGMDADARLRIINTLVYGDPDPEKAVAELVAYDQRLAQAQKAMLGDLAKTPNFTGLTELLGDQ
jgi:hypothetical protein